MASYALWVAVFHAGAVVLILSKGENEAKVFLKRIKFIHSRLPKELPLRQKAADFPRSITRE